LKFGFNIFVYSCVTNCGLVWRTQVLKEDTKFSAKTKGNDVQYYWSLYTVDGESYKSVHDYLNITRGE